MNHDKKCNQCNKDAKFACKKCERAIYCSQTCANIAWRNVHYKNCGSYMLIEGKRGRDNDNNQPPEPMECFNEDDPITLESISDLEPENIFVLHVGDKKYCFQLDSLVQWIQHNPVNPLTRQVITERELVDITDANGRLLEKRRREEQNRVSQEMRTRSQIVRNAYDQYLDNRYGPYQRGNRIQIFVIWITGRTSAILTHPDESIDTIRRIVADIYMGRDENPNEIRFIFSGKQLENGYTLKDYNITSDSTLHSLLRVGFSGIHLPWQGPPSFL